MFQLIFLPHLSTFSYSIFHYILFLSSPSLLLSFFLFLSLPAIFSFLPFIFFSSITFFLYIFFRLESREYKLNQALRFTRDLYLFVITLSEKKGSFLFFGLFPCNVLQYKTSIGSGLRLSNSDRLSLNFTEPEFCK